MKIYKKVPENILQYNETNKVLKSQVVVRDELLEKAAQKLRAIWHTRWVAQRQPYGKSLLLLL